MKEDKIKRLQVNYVILHIGHSGKCKSMGTENTLGSGGWLTTKDHEANSKIVKYHSTSS